MRERDALMGGVTRSDDEVETAVTDVGPTCGAYTQERIEESNCNPLSVVSSPGGEASSATGTSMRQGREC
jgi:hypothetical protein